MIKDRQKELRQVARESELSRKEFTECLDEIEKLQILMAEGINYLEYALSGLDYITTSFEKETDDWLSRAKEALEK